MTIIFTVPDKPASQGSQKHVMSNTARIAR